MNRILTSANEDTPTTASEVPSSDSNLDNSNAAQHPPVITNKKSSSKLPWAIALVVIFALIGALVYGYSRLPQDFQSCESFIRSQVRESNPRTCTTFYGTSFVESLEPSQADSPYKDIQTYTHPLGFSFAYPADYRVSQGSENSLTLTPLSGATESATLIQIEPLANPQNLSPDRFVDNLLSEKTQRGTDNQFFAIKDKPELMSAIKRESTYVNYKSAEKVLGMPSRSGMLQVFVPFEGKMLLFSQTPFRSTDFETAEMEGQPLFNLLASVKLESNSNQLDQKDSQASSSANPVDQPVQTKGGAPVPTSNENAKVLDVSTWTKHKYPSENLILYAPSTWKSDIISLGGQNTSVIRFWQSGTADAAPVQLEIKPTKLSLNPNYTVAGNIPAQRTQEATTTQVIFNKDKSYILNCTHNNSLSVKDFCHALLQTME